MTFKVKLTTEASGQVRLINSVLFMLQSSQNVFANFISLSFLFFLLFCETVVLVKAVRLQCICLVVGGNAAL